MLAGCLAGLEKLVEGEAQEQYRAAVRDLAQPAMDRLGWNGDRFDVFRCRVEFPVNPSTVVVWFPLPG